MEESITTTNKTPLVGMSLSQLQQVVAQLGMPRFTAKQLAEWIYVHRAKSFDEMNNISKANRARLQDAYSLGLKAPIKEQRSVDGTAKYLFGVGDGQAVESVYIPDDDRATLCISSQKGCRMNCHFCMTGKQGYHGNLTANQIINQVLSVPESESLTNVVFMGMGEPMDNLQEVMQAIEVMTAPWGLAWSPKRITVSSIGKIRELTQLVEQTNVHIAISVHSPYHAERASLMPVENAYPINKVMRMLSNYDFAHQRRLSLEYIMFNGLNDDMEHAQALEQLIDRQPIRVNLIRFHAIPGVNLKTSDEERMVRFRDYLNSRGIICTIRRSRGEDIFAACGMLAGKNKK
ncbi:MAG: 23S rRNA (adenine(2503)-C(2))-methyltransferase RlmN [Bacteroidales bacterium]|nr:23S rRNA (adenine(2503)-C(2))-methyltransferase RlmN [Bacteroidales bacterium]